MRGEIQRDHYARLAPTASQQPRASTRAMRLIPLCILTCNVSEGDRANHQHTPWSSDNTVVSCAACAPAGTISAGAAPLLVYLSSWTHIDNRPIKQVQCMTIAHNHRQTTAETSVIRDSEKPHCELLLPPWGKITAGPWPERVPPPATTQIYLQSRSNSRLARTHRIPHNGAGSERTQSNARTSGISALTL